MGHRKGAGEPGAATLSLSRQAGRPAPVHPATLFRFGNFMKKKGRGGTTGEETAGGYCSPDTWRRASWSGRRMWAGGGRENGMMEGGGLERERGYGCGLAGDGRARSVGSLPPPSSQFHFHGLLKISQSAISFSLSSLPRYLPATGRQGYPTPVAVVILMSL